MLRHLKRTIVVLCLLHAIVSTALYSLVARTYRRVLNKTISEPRAFSVKSADRTISNCSTRLFDELINAPLRTMVDDHVDVNIFERSGCFVIDTEKNGLYRVVHGNNFGHVTCNQTQKRFLSPTINEKRTALASVPGSGNTWTRHLLEELTGINTGSICYSRRLKKVFHGEGMVRNVIAIKTHRGRDAVKGDFSHAMLIVRDPLEAARAEYNRRKAKGQTGIVDKKDFNKTEFMHLVNKELATPEKSFNVKWISEFKGELLVLFYEELKTDLLNSLTKMAAFIQSEVTLTKLWCVLQNQGGLFHRKQGPPWLSRENLTNENLANAIQTWKTVVQKAIDKRTLGNANTETFRSSFNNLYQYFAKKNY